MCAQTRRAFLKNTGLEAAGAAIAWAAPSSQVLGANERVITGLIGCGGRGSTLSDFAGWKMAYVCDPDQQRCHAVKQKTGAASAVSDLRRVLDDKSVDAVVIATPDHWHAPAAILACEAGKHVYVEKPCSHNVREGRLLVEAARRNKRVVQHGTQSRSNGSIARAVQMLREGLIGDVLAAKAWNVQRRKEIGHAQPSNSPPGVDYDMWVGPAEFLPYQSNRFHYTWHWWYNFGTGDMGNDGTHEIDYARWGLGVQTHPSTVVGLGGKYFFDDDQQFPDTAAVVFEYPGDGKVGSKRQLIFEMRLWSTNYPFNCDSGAEFYGTKGKMFISKRGKFEVLGNRNEKINVDLTVEKERASHAEDFLEAIKTGRKPNAEIDEGQLSTTLVHLGNIAVRLGRSLKFDPKTETISGDEEANRLLGRAYRKEGHWAIPKGVS